MLCMPTGECLFEEIAMHLVGDFLKLERFYAIALVTDHFIKVENYKVVKRTCTAKDVADSYISNICRLCDLLRYITLNSCMQFA